MSAMVRALSTPLWLVQLALAFAILFVEGFMHILWTIFPLSKLWRSKDNSNEHSIYEANFVELARHYGYDCEEHFVRTKDGYILGLHRMSAVGGPNPNAGEPSREVVLIQHGLLQCSESFVARGPSRDLAYMLVDAGYDVWLGNNRGTKYSFKHECYGTHEEKFWDFCLDDLAMSDVPAMLEYVCHEAGVPKLTYIGFSQGSAQCFAALSMLPSVAARVKQFIALAPATRTQQWNSPLIAALTTSKPKLVYLLFGKHMLLGEALFWRRRLAPARLVSVMDFCMKALFGWTTQNINPAEKSLLYTHLYSYSSVKCVVQWFQITRTQRFQMYDSNVLSLAKTDAPTYHSYVLPHYDISKITVPVAVFYGGRDTVPDNQYLVNNLPPGSFVHCEPDYEHLDLIWADDAAEKVFRPLMQLMTCRS